MAVNVWRNIARLRVSHGKAAGSISKYSTTVTESGIDKPPEVSDIASSLGDLKISGDPESCATLYNEPLEAWVETLGEKSFGAKTGCVYLHPDVFGAFPRVDLLHWNVYWQRMYRWVDWSNAPITFEMKGGGRKPWPQKGTGRARHGSIRSPLWHNGSKALGPRGPRTHYFMLPYMIRVRGLTSLLSCKFAQNDLRIVDSLDSLPTDDPKYLKELCEQRYWGPSVLFVHETDLAPRNLTLAVDNIGHMNIMPSYGVSVHSLLKHETVVLSQKSVESIQERLLFCLNRADVDQVSNYKVRPVIKQSTLPPPL